MATPMHILTYKDRFALIEEEQALQAQKGTAEHKSVSLNRTPTRPEFRCKDNSWLIGAKKSIDAKVLRRLWWWEKKL